MDGIHKTLEDFITDYCEYLPPEVPELPHRPTTPVFLNNYVMPSLPFIIRDPHSFEAVGKWNREYFRQKIGFWDITVSATPDGRADSIVDDKFMIPEERTMNFMKFYDTLGEYKTSQVFYLQTQNNNLIMDFAPIRNDVDVQLAWATEAFDCLPEAVNIWMGSALSVTSMHKDHYENIFYVIKGWKKFILYPPIAMSWMPYQKCKKYQWYFENQEWKMKDLNEEIKWIPNSRKPETLHQFRMFNKTKMYSVTLQAGDCLYLPALWFHEVSQSDHCVAVNYWYDMKYDVKLPFLRLLKKLSNLYCSRKHAAVDVQNDLQFKLVSDLISDFSTKAKIHGPKSPKK